MKNKKNNSKLLLMFSSVIAVYLLVSLTGCKKDDAELPLPAPLAIEATNVTNNSFTANWNPVDRAIGYQLDISVDNFTTYVDGYENRAVDGNNHDVTGLSENSTYQYRLRAVGSNQTTDNSNVIQVTTTEMLLTKQVRVQVAYDATSVAFRFSWKSQKKIYPIGQANVGQNYPGQFHEPLKHDGTSFNRLPSGQRMEEDRVTFMIDKFDGGIANFAAAGCAITCHSGAGGLGTFNDPKHLLTNDKLDFWHWRGSRSAPMGYAEDTFLDQDDRQRDAAGTPPSKFTRAGGDRLREDQAAFGAGFTEDPVLVDRFPRFVFNKGKNVDGFTIPSYFLADESNNVVTNPYIGLPGIKDVTNNRSLIVVYQDRTFDPVDKVNALDLGYLVWVGYNITTQLPAHLQFGNDAYDDAAFTVWKNWWATESGVAATPDVTAAANAANAKLAEVHAEWTAASKNAMVLRGVGFIYNSDQHDITSTRFYDVAKNEWTVILKRQLASSSANDTDLSGLPGGTKYSFSFAMHDAGAAAVSHDISTSYIVAKDAGENTIQAVSVSNVNNANWSIVPIMETNWVKQTLMPKYTWDWLKSGDHAGAGSTGTTNCVTCHTGSNSLTTTNILQ